MESVFVLSAKRTPQGSFGGVLSSLTAVELGTVAIEAALDASGIVTGDVQEVYMGNVCQANLGQAPARQAALAAGISDGVPATTVNKVCASGMKALMLGAQSIQLGINDVVVCGGMESMSNIPYYAPHQRWGRKYGDASLVDGLTKDGLTDAFDQVAMGVLADAVSKQESISREDQDAYAIQSYERARLATESGAFASEITPVHVPQRKGDDLVIRQDEEYKKVNFEKIPQLRPAFSPDGTATAANASTINDGAAALVLAGEGYVHKMGLQPLARLIDYSDAALAPEQFTLAPIKAAQKLMHQQAKTTSQIDLFEVNEAFSMVPLAFVNACGISQDVINIHGGGVSLGHPIGVSGARIVTTLIHALHQKNLRTGLASICNGGGGGSALMLEKI
ncbi:MAG: acetyl-CoA C-acyltransferase [Flavobacteriaceae bacterium]